MYFSGFLIVCNVRSQFMAHHHFMTQFCDCTIKCVLKYFLRLYSLIFDAFFITGLLSSSNDTILSPFCHNLAFFNILSKFCHHLFTIYYEMTETIQQQQAQSRDQGILKWYQKVHCCHWIDDFYLEQCGSIITNDNWCMWVSCSCTLPT